MRSTSTRFTKLLMSSLVWLRKTFSFWSNPPFPHRGIRRWKLTKCNHSFRWLIYLWDFLQTWAKSWDGRTIPCPPHSEHTPPRCFSIAWRSTRQQQDNSKEPPPTPICRVGRWVAVPSSAPHKAPFPHCPLLQALSLQPWWDTAVCYYSTST